MARKLAMESVEGLIRKRDFWYENIFLVGSLLYSGNVIQYFSRHCQKLAVFYLNKTLKDQSDFIQIYQKGVLWQEKKLFIPKLPVIYYLFVYFWYWRTILQYFSRKEKFFVLTFHPLFFFFSSILKGFRNFEIVFWVIDYLPAPSFFLKIYQSLIFYYHQRNKYNLYLSDQVNEIMNGVIKKNPYQKTVMWGVKLRRKEHKRTGNETTLGFIGVVKPSQGLKIAFSLLKKYKNILLKVLGECEPSLYREYQVLMAKLGISNQIMFANKFYPSDQLGKELGVCDIGLALYSQDKNNPIYYTDSGKIKTYLEFGLPVIMTTTSATLPFVKRFKAGEIVKPDIDSIYKAMIKIKNNYRAYLDGVSRFNEYFNVEKYYRKAFKFLEN